MGYVMKQNLARKENYGSERSTADIKYLVIHYTSNDGDSDESNGKYFVRRRSSLGLEKQLRCTCASNPSFITVLL